MSDVHKKHASDLPQDVADTKAGSKKNLKQKASETQEQAQSENDTEMYEEFDDNQREQPLDTAEYVAEDTYQTEEPLDTAEYAAEDTYQTEEPEYEAEDTSQTEEPLDADVQEESASNITQKPDKKASSRKHTKKKASKTRDQAQSEIDTTGSRADDVEANAEFDDNQAQEPLDAAEGVAENAPTDAGEPLESAEGAAEGAPTDEGEPLEAAEGAAEDAPTDTGEPLEATEEAAEGAPTDTGEPLEAAEGAAEGAPTDTGEPLEAAEGAAEGAPTDAGETELLDLSILEGKKVNKLGKIVDDEGVPYGQLIEGEAKKLVGKEVDAEGKIWNDRGKVLGRAELLPESERPRTYTAPFEEFPDAVVEEDGTITFDGQVLGRLVEGDAKKLAGKKVDEDGDVLDKNGNVVGKAERIEEEPVPEVPEPADLSSLEGMKVNKAGNVVDENGEVFGRLVEGEATKLVGKKVDSEGKIWNDSGKVIGTVELIPIKDETPEAPFENFPDAIVEKDGTITFDGQVVGNLVEGDAKKLAGKTIDKDGDILDKHGNVLGKAERVEEEEPVPEVADLSSLEGMKVNKAGNVVDENGEVFGRLVEGEATKLVGKKVDGEGKIWNDLGKVIGTVELIPIKDETPEAPFENFPDSIVEKDGTVTFDGQVVGKLVEGDSKKLAGKTIDKDGDILDKHGNVLGKAERVEEEEPVPEVADLSSLEGMKVNKAGNVVDENGKVFGRLVEGEAAKLFGKKVDGEGKIWNDLGKVIGTVELIPIDTEETPEAPFENFPDSIVEKNGTITFDSQVVGKLVEGDAKKLAGKTIDKDGDILDKHGNVLGKAERVEEEEPVPEVADLSSLEGMKVNKAGNVVDENGKLFGRLVDGDAAKLVGKKVDGEGKIWNDLGKVIGTVELIPIDKGDETPEAPFEDFPDAVVEKNGTITFDGKVIGKLIEGDAKKLAGKTIDKDGDVVDKIGNVLGKAERVEEEEPVLEVADLSSLKGKKVNKAGNVVDENGKLFGRLVEGDAAKLVGKKVDGEGKIWNDLGKVIGRAELIPIDTGDETPEEAPFEDFPDAVVEKNGTITFNGKVIGKLIEGDAKKLAGKAIDKDGDVVDKIGNVLGKAERVEEEEPVPEVVDLSSLEGKKVNKAGNVVDENGKLFGRLVEGEVAKLYGKKVDREGKIWSESGKVIGRAELIPPDDRDESSGAPFEDFPDAIVNKNGTITFDGQVVGRLIEGDAKKLAGKKIDKDGEVVDKLGNVLGKSERWEEEEPEVADLSSLEGKKVNKAGNIVDDNGKLFGRLVEGEAAKLIGKKVDREGNIWGESGKVIGRAELIPTDDRDESSGAPFEDFPDAIVNKNGTITFNGQVVGRLIEGDAKKLAGKKIDKDGEVVDKLGNVLGKSERWEEEEPEVADLSSLEGKKVNKAGNIVDDNGKLFGRLVEGEAAKLIGKKVDREGNIWGESGKVIGRAELLPIDDRDEPSGGLFEDFPDAIVNKNGTITFDGKVVGRLTEGDAKKLAGKRIDKDGEVVDKLGNVLGKSERWEEEEAPEPEKKDLSALAGKRVNKAGNVVDSNGNIFGRLVEGDPKKLAGKMCDKNGDVWNEGGDIVGKAELLPESEREGIKLGPFSDFDNPTVTKDGKVVDSKGTIIGRLVEGDAKKLYGKPVDPDGDILDKNGNSLGKAERWEEEEKEKPRHAAAGLKVNRQGDVFDENGDLIAKLTEGEISKCYGKEIDDDGDVLDGKGKPIGHVTILQDIPEPEEEPVEEEPKESEEEMKERQQLEQDKKVATQIASCVQQSLDEIKPILKLITDAIDDAERQPKEELDEQKLVDTLKPLIEQGGQILQEVNGAIRGLDPDGRIQASAKQKTAAREAQPEEYHLAEVLKELTENAAQTIDKAKKKIAGMPHEPKETEEEMQERWQLEQDKKLATQIASCVQQSLDKVKPVLKMITDAIDDAERQPKEELDEQKLVDIVKPLIEQGGQILQEANGAIRGLDPDGRIQASAKHKTAAREAQPEEYRLAEVLKELTESVAQTIDMAKKKIAGMPHVKKELNPLWGLLAEPLGQILAAVGLLLSGVLGLVGRLLSVLGLGGLLDNLLGGLGIKGILQGLGLGTLTKALTGKK